MSEPSILWNRLTASPILFNVIYSRIIYARNALTANRTSRIGVEQLLLQRTGKTARLQGLILKNRIKTVFVALRGFVKKNIGVLSQPKIPGLIAI